MKSPQQTLERVAKRVLDVAVSGSALVALSPVLSAIALLDGVLLGWPPVFSQTRPGFQGKLFTIHKFRTMTDRRGPDGLPLPDRDRLTRFGAWLRASSLDELPELVDVLRGKMSLVGPRPLLVQYLGRYSAEQMRRHDVPPGITGWAQVHGRNSLTWDEKFALDLWYVENWSLRLDLAILLKTLRTVLRREGISAAGVATMTEFMGSESNDVTGPHAPKNSAASQ